MLPSLIQATISAFTMFPNSLCRLQLKENPQVDFDIFSLPYHSYQHASYCTKTSMALRSTNQQSGTNDLIFVTILFCIIFTDDDVGGGDKEMVSGDSNWLSFILCDPAFSINNIFVLFRISYGRHVSVVTDLFLQHWVRYRRESVFHAIAKTTKYSLIELVVFHRFHGISWNFMEFSFLKKHNVPLWLINFSIPNPAFDFIMFYSCVTLFADFSQQSLRFCFSLRLSTVFFCSEYG